MKVIDRLETFKTGRAVYLPEPLNYIKLEQTSVPTNTRISDRIIEYRTEARLAMVQLGSGTNPAEQQMLHDQAARAIARELYGDVVDRLYDILHKLYEDGPRYDNKISTMVSGLINELELR